MSVDNDDRMMEVYRQMSQQQEKYTYYIIALCVSAIGFSVYCTLGKSLHWSQIPLGFAVFSWGISIFGGLKYIEVTFRIKFRNFQKLEIRAMEQAMNPGVYQLAKDKIDDSIELYSKKSNFLTAIQEYAFYFGVISFLIWHIFEMALVK